jgi:hypothetical protein
VVSLTSSSGGYINGRNSANLELLIDKTSSIYLNVKLVNMKSGLIRGEVNFVSIFVMIYSVLSYLDFLFRSFGFLAPKNFKIISLSNILPLSLLDEGYSRDARRAINLISTFLIQNKIT